MRLRFRFSGLSPIIETYEIVVDDAVVNDLVEQVNDDPDSFFDMYGDQIFCVDSYCSDPSDFGLVGYSFLDMEVCDES